MGVVRRMGTKMISFSFFFFFFFVAATHAFPSDGPLNMEALNMLHADAVKFGAGAKDNKWFEAVDAKTLDGMITEMNTMNRWFAKVVKYWDDFTSGGDGAKVLAEQGKGINEDEPVDGAVDPPADGGILLMEVEMSLQLMEQSLVRTEQNLMRMVQSLLMETKKLILLLMERILLVRMEKNLPMERSLLMEKNLLMMRNLLLMERNLLMEIKKLLVEIKKMLKPKTGKRIKKMMLGKGE